MSTVTDNFIDYLKASIKPQGTHEFNNTDDLTQQQADALVQDGFALATTISCTDKSKLEIIKYGDRFLVKKTLRNIQWLDESSGKFSFDITRTPIYRRIIPPPCETADHVLIIKSFIDKLNQEPELDGKCTYVEYGVRTGTSLLPISELCAQCYGIDIERCPNLVLPNNCTFYKMSTDRFSELHLKDIKFNAAFIDADHSSASAFKDFESIYKHIQPGGYIFLHDTYPCESFLLKPEFCNDCYKTPIRIKSKYPDIEIITIPLNPGISVVRKTI